MLQRGAGSDAAAWEREFGLARDVSRLTAEVNALRYSVVPVTVRYEGGPVAHLLRVLAAGVAAGAPVTVSVATGLDEETASLVRATGATYVVEDGAAWATTLSGSAAPGRVRLLGGTREAFAAASQGRVDIALYAQPVVEAGRVELLTFLHEQAVSVTAHRFGSPTPLVDNLF